MASPSGSAAESTNERLVFSATVFGGTALIVGARLVLAMVSVVEPLEVRTPSVALQLSVYVPACVNDGVQLNVPLAGFAGVEVKVAPAGSPVTVNVTTSAAS